MVLFTRLIILIASVFILSCSIPTYEKYVDQWTGEPIQRILEIYKREGSDAPSKYQLNNGNDVYIITSWSCKVHWEVDDYGIILGVHKNEGDCRF